MQWRCQDLRLLGAIAVSAAALQIFTAPAHAAGGVPAPQSKPAGKPVSDWCAALVARLPKVSLRNCRDSQLLPTGAWSQNGFPILARDIAGPGRQPALKVLLIGGIHGDELSASAIVFNGWNCYKNRRRRSFSGRSRPSSIQTVCWLPRHAA